MTPEIAHKVIAAYGNTDGRKVIPLPLAQGIIAQWLLNIGYHKRYDPRRKYEAYETDTGYRYVFKRITVNKQEKAGDRWRNITVANAIDVAWNLLRAAGEALGNEELVSNALAWKRTREMPRNEARKERDRKEVLARRTSVANKILEARERAVILPYLLGGRTDRQAASYLATAQQSILAQLEPLGDNLPSDDKIFSLDLPPILPIFGTVPDLEWTQDGVRVRVWSIHQRAAVKLTIGETRVAGSIYQQGAALLAFLGGLEGPDPLSGMAAWCRILRGYGLPSFTAPKDEISEEVAKALRRAGYKIRSKDPYFLVTCP